MWFLPSYGRPDFAKRLIESPGGMPDELCVVVNEDDPRFAEYYDAKTKEWPFGWWMLVVPAGSRLCDAYNEAYRMFPDLPWYGMFGDDHFPQTPDWHSKLVESAGSFCMSYSNGAHTEFPLMRGTCVLGGELVKTLGWLVMPGLRHNYIDVVLDTICRDVGILRPREDVMVDHLHWKFVEGVVRDATYERGSADQSDDAFLYHQWLGSRERAFITNRVSARKAELGIV